MALTPSPDNPASDFRCDKQFGAWKARLRTSTARIFLSPIDVLPMRHRLPTPNMEGKDMTGRYSTYRSYLPSNVTTIGRLPSCQSRCSHPDFPRREGADQVSDLPWRPGELMRSWGSLRYLFSIRKESACRVASLTQRQRQVMNRVLDGQPSKNIAQDLGISQRTVENHRAAIMRKIGVSSLPELTILALAATWDGAEDLTGAPEIPDRRVMAG